MISKNSASLRLPIHYSIAYWQCFFSFLLLLRRRCKITSEEFKDTPPTVTYLSLSLSRIHRANYLSSSYLRCWSTFSFHCSFFMLLILPTLSLQLAFSLTLASIRLLRCSSGIVLHACEPLPWHQKLRKISRYTFVLKQHHDKRSGWIPRKHNQQNNELLLSRCPSQLYVQITTIT